MTALYEVLELTFPAGTAMSDEEKSALRLDAAFAGPDGRLLTMPGFWAGGDMWKIRFAPTAPGPWTWRVSSELAALNGLGGAFVCEAAAGAGRRGFVQADPRHPYHVRFSDGEPVYLWGSTAYYLLQERLEGHAGHWREFIVQSKAHGMNKIRFLVHLWDWGNYYGRRWYPWRDCTAERPRFRAFEPAYWEGLDEIVAFMQEQGVIAELILFTNHPTSGKREPDDPGLFDMTEAEERLYLRHIAARYSACGSVIWCLTNEWHYHVRARYVTAENRKGEVPAGWVYGLAEGLCAVDPYIRAEGRLISAHQKTTKHFSFKTDSWATHCSTQFGMRNRQDGDSYRYGHDWGNVQILLNRGYGKPVFNDEYGYDGDAGEAGAAGTDEKEQAPIVMTREVSRSCAWGIAMAGGYGTYGEKHARNGSYLYSGYKNSIWYDYPSQDDVKVLVDFMNGLDYRRMHPDNGLVPIRPQHPGTQRFDNRVFPYVLASPGREYAVYLVQETGAPLSPMLVQLILRAGVYRACWYSTTTGEPVKEEGRIAIGQDGAHAFLSPPIDYDIALKVTLEERADD